MPQRRVRKISETPSKTNRTKLWERRSTKPKFGSSIEVAPREGFLLIGEPSRQSRMRVSNRPSRRNSHRVATAAVRSVADVFEHYFEPRDLNLSVFVAKRALSPRRNEWPE